LSLILDFFQLFDPLLLQIIYYIQVLISLNASVNNFLNQILLINGGFFFVFFCFFEIFLIFFFSDSQSIDEPHPLGLAILSDLIYYDLLPSIVLSITAKQILFVIKKKQATLFCSPLIEKLKQYVGDDLHGIFIYLFIYLFYSKNSHGK